MPRIRTRKNPACFLLNSLENLSKKQAVFFHVPFVYFSGEAPRENDEAPHKNVECVRDSILTRMTVNDYCSCTLPAYLLHTSYVHLPPPHTIASKFPLPLSTMYPLYVRYLFGQTPNIYRTSTGHLPDMNGSYSLAVSLFHGGYLLVVCKMFLRCSLDVSKIVRTRA